jgi:GntR family transcriptional regulator/MocR family aminotransferase
VLFPSLRLAYLVLPKSLMPAFVAARTLIDGHSALINQIVLSEFMREGHFTAHIRRMRQLYSARREAFHESFEKHLSCFGTLEASGGLHVTVELNRDVTEALTTRAAQKCDIELPTLRRLYLDRGKKDGWLMGFAALAPGEAARGMAALAQAIKREMVGNPVRDRMKRQHSGD